MVNDSTDPIMMTDIPEDWSFVTLRNCVTEPLSYGINAPAIPFNCNYPCYLRITDITESGQYDDSDKKSVVTSDLERYTLHSGNIVLARTGASVGKSYLYDPKDGNLVYAGFLIRAVIDLDRFNPKFVVSQLRTKRYWKWVSTVSMRSGQPGINSKEYSSFTIPMPKRKKEQDAIASILTNIDTYIDSLTELIEKKRNIRDGALEDLVSGRTRILKAEAWKEYTIEEITSAVITGGTPSTSHPEYYGGNIPWLSSTEIHQKYIAHPTTYITEAGLQNSSAKIAPENSVLIALAGQGKTRGTAAYLGNAMALNQSLAALVSNDKCDSKFLFYLMDTMYLRLRELSSGDGGRGGLNKKLIKSVTVNIPADINEQKSIADALTAMDKEITNLEAERNKMMQIREGAMDDLLTGRVRLKV